MTYWVLDFSFLRLVKQVVSINKYACNLFYQDNPKKRKLDDLINMPGNKVGI